METTIDGCGYRLEKLPTIQQFHVARRIAPAMPLGSKKLPAEFAKTAEDFTISIALSKLSQADADYVIQACLSVCSIRQDNAWRAVMANGQIMFDQIQLPTLMRLVQTVIAENIGGFFPELPSQEPGTKPAAETPNA